MEHVAHTKQGLSVFHFYMEQSPLNGSANIAVVWPAVAALGKHTCVQLASKGGS